MSLIDILDESFSMRHRLGESLFAPYISDYSFSKCIPIFVIPLVVCFDGCLQMRRRLWAAHISDCCFEMCLRILVIILIASRDGGLHLYLYIWATQFTQ